MTQKGRYFQRHPKLQMSGMRVTWLSRLALLVLVIKTAAAVGPTCAAYDYVEEWRGADIVESRSNAPLLPEFFRARVLRPAVHWYRLQGVPLRHLLHAGTSKPSPPPPAVSSHLHLRMPPCSAQLWTFRTSRGRRASDCMQS